MIINGRSEPGRVPGFAAIARKFNIDLGAPASRAFNRPAPRHVVLMGSGENSYNFNIGQTALPDSYCILFRDWEHFAQIREGLKGNIARFIFHGRSAYFAICEGTDLMNETFVGSFSVVAQREIAEADISAMMKGVFVFGPEGNIRKIGICVFSEKVKPLRDLISVDQMYLQLAIAVDKLGCAHDTEIIDYASPVPELAHYLVKKGIKTLGEMLKYFA